LTQAGLAHIDALSNGYATLHNRLLSLVEALVVGLAVPLVASLAVSDPFLDPNGQKVGF
jgi:hypothetical protein